MELCAKERKSTHTSKHTHFTEKQKRKKNIIKFTKKWIKIRKWTKHTSLSLYLYCNRYVLFVFVCLFVCLFVFSFFYWKSLIYAVVVLGLSLRTTGILLLKVLYRVRVVVLGLRVYVFATRFVFSCEIQSGLCPPFIIMETNIFNMFSWYHSIPQVVCHQVGLYVNERPRNESMVCVTTGLRKQKIVDVMICRKCGIRKGQHFFFIFRFTSPPTQQKLTRHKIKIPIIYFLFPMGRFILPKSMTWRTFSIKHLKKWKMSILFLNLFPPPSRIC